MAWLSVATVCVDKPTARRAVRMPFTRKFRSLPSSVACSLCYVRPWVAGIAPGPKGAYSVALSGGYEDDIDEGEALYVPTLPCNLECIAHAHSASSLVQVRSCGCSMHFHTIEADGLGGRDLKGTKDKPKNVSSLLVIRMLRFHPVAAAHGTSELRSDL